MAVHQVGTYFLRGKSSRSRRFDLLVTRGGALCYTRCQSVDNLTWHTMRVER